MGDFDDGLENGSWGADGMPHWMDEVDNTAEIKKLKQELQTLKRTIPVEMRILTTMQAILVLAASIFSYGAGGVILALIFILYNEPKKKVYEEHMQKIYIIEEQIEHLYSN